MRAFSLRLGRLVGRLIAASALVALGGCSINRISMDPIIADLVVDEAKKITVTKKASDLFAEALISSAKAPTDPAAAEAALRHGRAMLDLQCERYLDALGIANQQASHQRKQTDLVGGFAAAVMGLTGSPAKHIAAVATSAAFAGSSHDAFTTSYLFSDASKAVTKLVRSASRTYLDELKFDPTRLDYPAVIEILTGYESLCRPAQIRRLVDEAISNATIVAEVRGQGSSDQEVTRLLIDLTAALGRPVGEADAITLYAWWTLPERRAKLAKEAPIDTLLTSIGGASKLSSALARAFTPLIVSESQVISRWKSSIDRIRAESNGSDKKVTEGATSSGGTELKSLRSTSAVQLPMVRVK